MMRPARNVFAGASRLAPAAAACAIAASAVNLAAQTPRVAPPPPCRIDDRAAVAALTLPRSAPAGRVTVAVMPVEARLSDGSQAHLPWAFARGVAAGLATLPGLYVPTMWTTERASLEAAGRVDQLGEVLGARLVVAGSMVSQRGGATLTVSVAERGAAAPRWERTFFYPQVALASIEDQVVAAVAEIIGATTPGEPREIADATAYDDVARGDYFMSLHESWAADSARAAYERALGRSAQSSVVLARLARAYAASIERNGRVGPLGPADALREADALVDRALLGDSASSDAWTARAILARVRDPRSFDGALAAHERAVRSASRSADAHEQYAMTLLLLGRDAAAEGQLRQALALERDRAASLRLRAELEYLARRYPSACAYVNAAIAADSYDPLAYALRARIRLRLEEFRDAFADAETARRLSTGAPWGRPLEFYVKAFAREHDAAKAEARRLSIEKLRGATTLDVREAVYLGMGMAAMGDRDKALDALTRARPQGAVLTSALRDPGFDGVRSDRRFSRIGRDDSASGRTEAAGGAKPRRD